MSSPAVVARGLSLGYRKLRVFDKQDFEIPSGATALLGPNGAGKTTLLRAIVGLKRPSAGDLVVLGHNVASRRSLSQVSRATSYLAQETVYNPRFTVNEHVAFAGWLKGLTGSQLESSTHHWVQAVGLGKHAQAKMRTLSGGMVRRATIAGAMVSEPTLLILDEPTVGLDPAQRVAFRELVHTLVGHTSLLLSTHLVEDVAAVCDSVAVLDGGQLTFVGSVSEFVQTAPAKTYTSRTERLEAAYLNAVTISEDIDA